MANTIKFKFSLSNLFRAVSWIAVGFGIAASLAQLHTLEDQQILGLLRVATIDASVIISIGAAWGTLFGKTRAGIVFGILMTVLFFVMVACTVLIVVWFS